MIKKIGDLSKKSHIKVGNKSMFKMITTGQLFLKTVKLLQIGSLSLWTTLNSKKLCIKDLLFNLLKNAKISSYNISP